MNNSSYLLVDLSYACFNKFYATKKYYSLSKPEISLENVESWNNVPGFIEQFKKSFYNDINNIVKKLKIDWNNLVFAKDCPRKYIWRNELYVNYKSTRDEMHKKQNFNGGEIFHYVYNTFIPELIKKHNIRLISCNNAEADDVVATITKYLMENTNSNVTIIANDNDYLQLLNDRVKLSNIKLKYKEIENNHEELWTKILVGDISDNIQPCYIKRDIINDSKKYKNNIIKCTKRNISKLVKNEEFLTKILNDPDLIENRQHLTNRQLIDFNFIPENIKDEIIKNFI